jgi:NitT/TauT family transport system ATP-binding protein
MTETMPRTEHDVEAPMVSVRKVSKTFSRRGASTQALRDVSLTVAAGEFVSLLGPSGCGKSTLLRIVGGLMDADRGEVEIAGDGPRHARDRKQFGLVPQTPALLPWRTVRDNVHLLHQLNRKRQGHESLTNERISELLDTVGLGRFLDAYPRELSGGMQQRVSLVRAFALGAPILLMDEPFAALDEITRADMRYLLLDLWERSGATVIFVTHSIPEAVILSDRVAVLAARPGRIAREEPIALPRPRHEAMEDSPEFHLHLARLRHALRESHAA